MVAAANVQNAGAGSLQDVSDPIKLVWAQGPLSDRSDHVRHDRTAAKTSSTEISSMQFGTKSHSIL